jgi:hypothetical protein
MRTAAAPTGTRSVCDYETINTHFVFRFSLFFTDNVYNSSLDTPDIQDR